MFYYFVVQANLLLSYFIILWFENEIKSKIWFQIMYLRREKWELSKKKLKSYRRSKILFYTFLSKNVTKNF